MEQSSKTLIPGRNEITFKEGVIYEDWLWLFHVMKDLSKLYICRDITYHYYLRPDSIVTGSDSLTVGRSFKIIFDEILHDLTPGGESAELNFYVESFCRQYMEHKEEISEYKILIKEYKKYSWTNGCWSSFVKLYLASFFGFFPLGLQILQQIRNLKTQKRHIRRDRNRVQVSIM